MTFARLPEQPALREKYLRGCEARFGKSNPRLAPGKCRPHGASKINSPCWHFLFWFRAFRSVGRLGR